MLSLLGQSARLSSQGAKGRLFVDTHGYQLSDLLPATPCFDLFHTKKELFSVEMIQFLIHHYAAGPASENPLIGPGGRQFHRRLFLSTEYKQAGTIFCGHADYCHNGPWYDWVMLRWAREDNQRYAGDPEWQAAYGDDPTIAIKHLYALGQLLGFVCPTPVDWINDHLTPEIVGVILTAVSTCDFSHTRESVFSTKWKQSYVYRAGNHKRPNIQLVDVNAILRHCLMVPHEESHSSYHEIWSQELWGNKLNDCS
jgi:hypothetical protein